MGHRHEHAARSVGPAPQVRRAGRAAPRLPTTDDLAASRVLIVDDNEWVRRGRAEALREADWPGEVVALDHRAALGTAWRAGDLVLVDAHDPSPAWDRYVGIAVVSAVRAHVGHRVASVIVMSDGPAPAALRDRAAEAGADHLVEHDHVRNPDELLALVRDPAARAQRLTIGRRGLTAALHVVEELDACELFTAPIPQKQSELSRRNIITLRQRLSRVLGLERPPRLRDLILTVNDARGAGTTALLPLDV